MIGRDIDLSIGEDETLDIRRHGPLVHWSYTVMDLRPVGGMGRGSGGWCWTVGGALRAVRKAQAFVPNESVGDTGLRRVK